MRRSVIFHIDLSKYPPFWDYHRRFSKAPRCGYTSCHQVSEMSYFFHTNYNRIGPLARHRPMIFELMKYIICRLQSFPGLLIREVNARYLCGSSLYWIVAASASFPPRLNIMIWKRRKIYLRLTTQTNHHLAQIVTLEGSL
jgi:hypothetical protein